MEQRHHRIAKIALNVAGSHGLALAGGYAIHAHGMGDRPSGDVDLFLAWERRADFPTVTDLVIAGFQNNGYVVVIDTRTETFARLLVGSPDSADTVDKVELAADWRSHPPVTLEVGPVLHPDDAVANKMAALYGRALPRDFLDIDAVLTSERYSRDDLMQLASAADAGFAIPMFIQVLGVLDQITNAAFAPYNCTLEDIAAMRNRFSHWQAQLRGADHTSGAEHRSCGGEGP